jgi:hypothetical protein
MLGAELEAWPSGSAQGLRVRRFDGLGAGGCRPVLQQRLAQALELLVLGMEIAQVVAGRIGRDQASSTTFGSRRAGFWSRCLLSCAGSMRPPRAMARILEDGKAELDLGAGEVGRSQLALRQLRQLEGVAASPQSSALAISAMAWRALAVKPAVVTQSSGSLRAP